MSASTAATIEGGVTRWETGEKLDGTVIRAYMDSELVSKVVCDTRGHYSLDLAPGSYHFIAIYIDKKGDMYVDEVDIV